MDGSAMHGAGGAASLSPTSPVSVRSHHAGLNGGQKRKRSAGGIGGMESSPGSIMGDDDLDHSEKKRQPGVKRACNECRQQKVSHHKVVVSIQCLYHHRNHKAHLQTVRT